MSNLLFIDTAGTQAQIGIWSKGSGWNISHHNEPNTQISIINTTIEKLLQKAHIQLHDLEAICMCAGPGSYTGLRVGLGVAKGLSYALEIPLLLFNRLQLIAQSFSDKEEYQSKNKLVLLKARKDEYFMGYYDQQNKIISEPQHLLKEELLNFVKNINNSTFIIADDEEINLPFETIISKDLELNFESWKVLAEERIENQDFDDIAYSEPFYLKAAYLTTPKNKTI